MTIIILFIISFVAAFVGTVAMTLSQEIEIRINKRPISHTPAIAVFKLLNLDFDQLTERNKTFISYTVHFAYGTFFGFPLAFFAFFDFVNFYPALIAYYVLILLQGWIVIPLLKIAGPPWSWGSKAILTEMFHKAVYSIVTVLVFLSFL